MSGSGSVTFQAGVAIWPFSTISVAGTLTFETEASIQTLQMAGSNGVLSVAAGITVTIDTLTMTGTGNSVKPTVGSPGGTVNVTNYFQWTGNNNRLESSTSAATGRFVLAPGSTANFAGTGTTTSFVIMLQFYNYGTVYYAHSGTLMLMWNPAVYYNMNATYFSGNTLGLGYYSTYTSCSFYNGAGAIVSSSMSTAATIGVPVNNYGRIESVQGTLSLNYGGTSFAGSTLAPAGGTLSLDAQTFNLNIGSTVVNATGFRVNGATVSVAGDFQPMSWSILQGSITFTQGGASFYWPSVDMPSKGTITMSGSLSTTYIDSLSITGNPAAFVVQNQARVVVGSLTMAGSNNDVTVKTSTPLLSLLNVTNSFSWSGTGNSVSGDTSGSTGQFTLAESCVTSITGGGTQYIQLQFNNYGTLTWSPIANVLLQSKGVLTNYGTMTMAGLSTGITYYSTDYTYVKLVNYGLIAANVTNTATINVPLHNYNEVRAAAGTLVVSYGGTGYSSSVLNTVPGGTLSMDGSQTFTVMAGSTVMNGTSNGFRVNGATVNVAGDYLPDINILAGTLTFTQPFVTFNWASVTMSAKGTINFQGTSSRVFIGTLSITGSTTCTLNVAGGTQVVVGTASLLGTSNTITVKSSTPLSMFNVTSSFTWGGTSNTLMGDTATTGLFNMLGAATFTGLGSQTVQLQLYNYGTLSYTPAAAISLQDKSALWNMGTMTTSGTTVTLNYVSPYQTTVKFNNYGRLLAGATVQTALTISVQNYGSIEATSSVGTVQMGYGGSFFADSTLKPTPGYIRFQAQTFNLLAGSTVLAGDGIQFAGSSTTTITGNFLPTTFQHLGTSTTVTFNQPLASFEFPSISVTSGGTLTFGGTQSLVSVGTLTVGGTAGCSFVVSGGTQVVAGSVFLTGTYASGSDISVYKTSTSVVNMLNITDTFSWAGVANSLLSNTAASSNALVNLMPTCVSTFTGTGTQTLELQLWNYGDVTYSAGGVGPTTTLTSTAGMRNVGSWRFYSAAALTTAPQSAGRNLFYNYGSIVVDVGSTMTFGYPMANYGDVTVVSGTLRLTYGGTGYRDSRLSHGGSGAIQFNHNGLTWTNQAGSVITEGDNIVFQAGTINIYGTFEPTTFDHQGAAVSFGESGSAYAFNSVSLTSGGSLKFGVTGELTSVKIGVLTLGGTTAVTFTLSSGSRAEIGSLSVISTIASGVAATIDLPSATAQATTQLNVTSYFEWSGPNVISGTAYSSVNILPLATGVISGSVSEMVLSCVLNIFGSVDLRTTGTGLRIASPGLFVVKDSGSVQVQGAAAITVAGPVSGGAGTFNNYGTMSVSPTTSFTMVTVPFNNYGTLKLQTGLTWFRAANTFNSGCTVTFGPASSLKLAACTIAAGATMKPAYSVEFNAAATVAAPLSSQLIRVTTGTTTWSGGGTVGLFSIEGGGLTIAASSAMTTCSIAATGASVTVNINAPTTLGFLNVTSGTATISVSTGNKLVTADSILVVAPSGATAAVSLGTTLNTILRTQQLVLGFFGTLSLGSTTQTYVARSFAWRSDSSKIAGGGYLSLAPTCITTIATSGTGTPAATTSNSLYATVDNYGYVDYQPTGASGLQLSNTAMFRNQATGVFNVSGNVDRYFLPLTTPMNFYFQNLGTIVVSLGATYRFLIGTILNNTGTINVVSGSLNPASLTHRGGTITVNAGGKIATSAITLAAGTPTALLQYGGFLQGTGSVTGKITQSGGYIHPGYTAAGGMGTPGTLIVESMDQSGTLGQIEIAVASPTVTSRLAVTGALAAAGIVMLTSTCPFIPSVGTIYPQVVTWGSQTGSFFQTLALGGIAVKPNTAIPLSLGLEVTASPSSWTCSNGNACVHGICCPTDVCNCFANWTGPSCDIPTCGDGIVIPPEGCDDGNTLPDDGCSPYCQVEPYYACVGQPSVCSPVCGDSHVVSPETCDDGNKISGDGCSSTCFIEPGWTCTGGGAGSCVPICGDGIKVGPETCDDGNSDPGDGCSETCQIEYGFYCNNATPSVCGTVCGDGIVGGTEQCDDGNNRPNDGCTACKIDPGWSCTGTHPSYCTPIGATSASTTGPKTTGIRRTSTGIVGSATTGSVASGGTGSGSPPPPPPPPPPTTYPPPPPPIAWPPNGYECGNPEDFSIAYTGYSVFSVSKDTGFCHCLSGYSTGGNVTAGSMWTANLEVAGPVYAGPIYAAVITASALRPSLFKSVQPSTRFSSSAAPPSGWLYTGESLTVTLAEATRIRFTLRQTVSNMAFAVSISSSSSSYVAACNAPTVYGLALDGFQVTVSAEWYCSLPATSSFYVFASAIGGAGNWEVFNEASASRAYSDFRATAI
eukprot:TRINITY_DN2484_c0_g1_i5.p1 TRINITY_DN2484_c0_g1~~TRINITY_DN2484_c0_g1_i5.p1  ORF type:complete len:2328 (-),score=839.52 TRINITY_DN2484_c0_g1_i5:902-7885(-)